MTQTVELEAQEWQQVITALAMSNPVLVKISTQLAQQQAQAFAQGIAANPKGNSQMAREIP